MTKHPFRTEAWHFARGVNPNLVGYDELVHMFQHASRQPSQTQTRAIFHLPSKPRVHLVLSSSRTISLLPWQLELAIKVPKTGEYTYIGAIDYEGVLRPSSALRQSDDTLKQQIWTVVQKLRTNPEAVITKLGKHSGVCSLCNRELTTPESIARGVGPKCAERFGLSMQPVLDLGSI